jgi:hypothetical protein
MQEPGLIEWHGSLLRAWQLAILRFAVTLDNADRLGVFAIANDIDRLGFRRTSTELCAAIPQRNATADALLQDYLSRIDDTRLKRAFAAALEIDQAKPTSVKRISNPESDLWRGLPSRGSVARY